MRLTWQPLLCLNAPKELRCHFWQLLATNYAKHAQYFESGMTGSHMFQTILTIAGRMTTLSINETVCSLFYCSEPISKSLLVHGP